MNLRFPFSQKMSNKNVENVYGWQVDQGNDKDIMQFIILPLHHQQFSGPVQANQSISVVELQFKGDKYVMMITENGKEAIDM